MDADLDRYLKQSQLTIFVFDDHDQRDDRYLARADIPLLPLAHDNRIQGTFHMRNDQGENNGTMDVILKWSYSYLPPSSSTRTPAQRLKGTPEKGREPLALLPDESVSGYKTIAETQREMKVRLTPRDVLGSDSEQRSKQGIFKKERSILFLIMPLFMVDLPRTSASSPASSISKPVRREYDNYRKRTSSNASSASGRGNQSLYFTI